METHKAELEETKRELAMELVANENLTAMLTLANAQWDKLSTEYLDLAQQNNRLSNEIAELRKSV